MPASNIGQPHMASTTNTNVVHESEIQRQHVRVRLPATIQFSLEGSKRRHRLVDISAGGFSFESPDFAYPVGRVFKGILLLSANSVGFSMTVSFQVLAVNAGSGRISCLFQDLGPPEIAALRHLIAAYLGGELVTAGDMLATLARDNFAPPRRLKDTSPGKGVRFRAIAGTGLALVIGIVAFAYTAFKLYDIVVVTHAAAGKVAARTYTIAMPRDGTFFSLVPADGKLKKGQALGSFQTALLDVVAGVPGSFKMSPEVLSQLVGQQLKGSLASPCDCVVQKIFVTDAQYVLRNQAILELVAQDTQPYVLARFHYNEIGNLAIGRKVHFSLSGVGKVEGSITALRVLPAQTIDSNGLNDLNGLNTNAAITDVIAVIVPTRPLDLSRIDEPVDVRIDPLDSWLKLPWRG